MDEKKIENTDAVTAAVKREATVMELATIIAESRSFPECRNPAAAAVRILAGREMGVGPIASVIGIRVQAGRVSMDAALMAGCIKRSGKYDYKIPPNAHDHNGCVIHFFENGELAGVSSFTMEDAKKAKLAGKDTWTNYPRNMLWARALANGFRWYCSALSGGAVYTHEELGYAVDEEGRAAAGETDEAGTGGGDLCSRDQRVRIIDLVQAAGKTLKELLDSLGIKMLDELSSYEATKLIKKLEKQTAGKVLSPGSEAGRPAAGPEPAGRSLHQEMPAQEEKQDAPAPVVDAPSSAVEMLEQAKEEVLQPSVPQQHERIKTLARSLEIPPAKLKEIIGRKGAQNLAGLNHLHAAALIEGMEKMLADKEAAGQQPPFDAT